MGEFTVSENDVLFRREELFRQFFMEDFRFVEAARMHSGEYESAILTSDRLFPQEKFREIVVTNPHGLVNFASYSSKPDIDEITAKVYASDRRSTRFSTRMARYPPLQIWAHWVLNTRFFKTMMVLVILFNSILIAWDQEMGSGDEFRRTRRMLEGIDFFFLCLFVAEIILKWMDHFHAFWFEGWNLFDLICTSASLIPPILDVIYPGDGISHEELEGKGILAAVKYLRIVRVFQSLNVVTRLRKIQIIWEAVLRTFGELVSITCVMAIFFYIFAIAGILLFERFTRSHKAGLKYRGAFENIPKAMAHLFLVFTVDHHKNFQDSLVRVMGHFIPVVYILIWILLAGFIFKNIFTGVMVNNFQNIRENLIEESTSIETRRRVAMELIMDQNEQFQDSHDKQDIHLGWEKQTLQDMRFLGTLGENLTATIWPRDTLFQYNIILDALASSIDERNYLMRQLDQALVRHMDP